MKSSSHHIPEIFPGPDPDHLKPNAIYWDISPQNIDFLSNMISNNELKPLVGTTFREQNLWERRDLQRLFKLNISVIDPDLLVIAEEFGEWNEGNRRIDLLAVDKNANLVVIELKRT